MGAAVKEVARWEVAARAEVTQAEVVQAAATTVVETTEVGTLAVGVEAVGRQAAGMSVVESKAEAGSEGVAVVVEESAVAMMAEVAPKVARGPRSPSRESAA